MIVLLTVWLAMTGVLMNRRATASSGQPQGKRPVSIDDSVGLKGVMGAQISPDGTRALFTVRAWEWPGNKVEIDKGARGPEMRSHIWMAPSDGNEEARQITYGERGEASPNWSPNGRYISFVATRGVAAAPADPAAISGGPKGQIYLMRVDGGEAQQLTDAKEGVVSYEWSPDGKQIAFISPDSLPKEEEEAQRRKDDEKVFEAGEPKQHLWTIDLQTKKAEQITSGGDFSVSSPSWSPDCSRIAFVARKSALVRDERSDISVVTIATKRVEPIAATPAQEVGPAWAPDGKTIAYTMTPIGDAQTNADGISTRPLYNSHLMLYDLTSKQTKDVSDPSFDYSVTSVKWTPDSRRLLFGAGDRVYRSIFAYDVDAKHYNRITKDKMITFGSMSKDGSKVAFTMDSPTAPTDVYVAGADFASPRKLTTMNPETNDLALGETEVLTWKSSDGWPIEGILVKPVGYEPGKKYPMLVDAHGGPTGAHTNGFKIGVHNGAQLWAGRGWAVLYPNPRGSSNYGEKFMRGNIQDWGGGDYRDIMAGVDEVVKRGVADPDKLAVMGWSYGGYMTCWIVSQTSRFKAARMGAGLSDLYSMYGATDIPGYIGTFFDNYPTEKTLKLYRERSGLTYVDNVTTPLLIMHGLNDERVPIGQPMEFYRALKDRGKIVELVWYPREGHGFSEYYHQRDQIRRELEWMTKYALGNIARRNAAP
jgi:dipeptidyl aminopeptidase/acylaminoacyl peptidase